MSPEPVGPAAPASSWPLRRRFPVVYHDIDVLNHLNHAAYFPFMETLRCEYYLPFLGSADPNLLDIILAEADCRYFAPVRFGTELLGEVAPARPIGRTSFVLLYRFTDPSTATVCARGRTVQVLFDYQRNRKKEIPSDRRERLERDAVDPGPEGWGSPDPPGP